MCRCGTSALGPDTEGRSHGHRCPAAVGVQSRGEASAHVQVAEERSAADGRGEPRQGTLQLCSP